MKSAWGTTAINSDTSANTAMLLLSTYTGIHINDYIQSPARATASDAAGQQFKLCLSDVVSP